MNRAATIALDTMLSALPADVLPSCKILSARFEGKNSVVAMVTMFDGLPAIARFNRWSLGWSHGWDLMEGGDVSFEDGRWVRVNGRSSMNRLPNHPHKHRCPQCDNLGFKRVSDRHHVVSRDEGERV